MTETPNFDSLYALLMEMSDYELENYPKGLVFVLPTSDRPSDLPPLPDSMSDHHFWHTGIVYDGSVYEAFNHAKSSISSASDRLKDPIFKNAIFFSTTINTSKLLSEVDSGTDCATYVGRVLGVSDTHGYEKDPKLYPDGVFDHLKKSGARVQRGVKELTKRKQTNV